jgi:hypothetical protein
MTIHRLRRPQRPSTLSTMTIMMVMAEPCCRDAIVPIRSIRDSRRGPSRSKTRTPCYAKHPRIKNRRAPEELHAEGNRFLTFCKRQKKSEENIAKSTTNTRPGISLCKRERYNNRRGLDHSCSFLRRPLLLANPKLNSHATKISLTWRDSMPEVAVTYHMP